MISIWNNFIGHEVKQSFYQAGNIRTRAIEAGQGEPLIFLHGTGGHAEAYSRNIVAHAEYFHVYSIDMIGHGFTDKPDNVVYNLDTYVQHLRDFVEAIGATKVNISGESLGGQVAIMFAYKYPELVNRIVINTGMIAPRSEQGMKELNDMLTRAKGAATTMSKEAVKKRLEWLMYDPNDVTEELIELRHSIYNQPGSAQIMYKITEGVISNESMDRDNSFLSEIETEALVFWSNHNPGASWEEAKVHALKFPNHKFYLMENDAAHWPQWENPEEFNKIHIDFLRFGIKSKVLG
jgi:2-hydroxy-6-oxonona-2,4-dienedioate hydrolase